MFPLVFVGLIVRRAGGSGIVEVAAAAMAF